VSERDFQDLVHEHYDRIFRAARFMCGDAQAAEDLVQETFLAAAESLGRFQGRSSTYTWLYGILLNKFRRWVRRKHASIISLHQLQGAGDEEQEQYLLPSEDPLPEEHAERRETIERVRLVMGELSPDHRAVIALRFVEGLSYQEIGQILGCPLGTVKSRIHYALQRIAEMLGDLEPP